MRSFLPLAALILACDPAPSTPEPIDPRAVDVCDAACIPGATCCTERFLHSSGVSIGWARRGAAMFAADAPEDSSVVLAQFKQWVAESPARAGLTAMPDTTPLAGLVAGPAPPRPYGPLRVHRFAQTYRALPVVGAGEFVSLTLSPGHGAVSVSGALVDARDTYAGWNDAMTPAAAITAGEQLLIASADEIDPVSFEFSEPRLVAVAEARSLAWEIEVFRNGHSRGTLLLRADSGAMLVFSPSAHFGPDDPVAVTIRARTFASDFFAYKDPDKQIVVDITTDPVLGGPLLGSTYTPLVCDDDPETLPICGEVRLGNDHVVVLDADHQNFYSDKTSHPRIDASPNGEFLADPPATGDDDSPMREDAALQDFFYRLQATYSLIDDYHAGHWDSFRSDSSFPAQAFKPRVILAHNMDIPALCGISQPGCTKFYWPHKIDPIAQIQVYDEHPEGDLPPHAWNDSIYAEVQGFIGTAVDGFKSPDLVFHEFGHVVDLFTIPGTIGNKIQTSGCSPAMKQGEKCVESCVLDSPDEGEALAETVADMIDLFSVGRLYTTVEHARCDAISGITSVSGPVHDPACTDDPGDIKSFLDQRPVEPGVVELDGVWLPTGGCGKAPGYRQTAILQAWWEWTHGRDCSPTAPFTCQTFADEVEGARSGMEALLFALAQGNATYYRKLFTDMEVHIACTQGPTRASQFRGVFCHHGALDCDGVPPVCPATCGDDKAELTEACDGDDLRGQDCFDHGFTAGALACRADCTYDVSACTQDPGTTGEPSPPEPTTPTSGPGIPTSGEATTVTSSSGGTDSEETAAGEQGEDGCGCRHGSSAGTGLLVLLPALMRRRRRLDAATSAGVR